MMASSLCHVLAYRIHHHLPVIGTLLMEDMLSARDLFLESRFLIEQAQYIT